MLKHSDGVSWGVGVAKCFLDIFGDLCCSLDGGGGTEDEDGLEGDRSAQNQASLMVLSVWWSLALFLIKDSSEVHSMDSCALTGLFGSFFSLLKVQHNSVQMMICL